MFDFRKSSIIVVGVEIGTNEIPRGVVTKYPKVVVNILFSFVGINGGVGS